MSIPEKDRAVIKEKFEALVEPVKLVVFTEGAIRPAGQRPCQYCAQVVALSKELAELSDKLEVEVVNFYAERAKVTEYGIQRIPALALVGAKDYGIRFYGIPAGFEFSALLETIVDVSRGSSDLSQETLEKLGRIGSPMHIQVFVTPTCPYCPPAVRLAYKFAQANEQIKADMVEAQEFPELAQRYGVFGVPRTVINETTHVEGAVPESIAVLYVLKAAGKLNEDEAKQLAAFAR